MEQCKDLLSEIQGMVMLLALLASPHLLNGQQQQQETAVAQQSPNEPEIKTPGVPDGDSPSATDLNISQASQKPPAEFKSSVSGGAPGQDMSDEGILLKPVWIKEHNTGTGQADHVKYRDGMTDLQIGQQLKVPEEKMASFLDAMKNTSRTVVAGVKHMDLDIDPYLTPQQVRTEVTEQKGAVRT